MMAVGMTVDRMIVMFFLVLSAAMVAEPWALTGGWLGGGGGTTLFCKHKDSATSIRQGMKVLPVLHSYMHLYHRSCFTCGQAHEARQLTMLDQ